MIMMKGEVIFPCIVVNLGNFVRDLKDHDWRRGYLSLHCCQPRKVCQGSLGLGLEERSPFPALLSTWVGMSGILRIRIGGEATLPFIVVKLGEFVRHLENHD